MLSKVRVHACRHCGSERRRKTALLATGRNVSGAWKVAARSLWSRKGPRYDQTFKDQVLAASRDRMSLPGHQTRLRSLPPDRHGLGGEKN